VNVCSAVREPASVSLTITVYVPSEVVVPLITPADEMVRPRASLPDDSLHL
jgi:hypothetical protein